MTEVEREARTTKNVQHQKDVEEVEREARSTHRHNALADARGGNDRG